MSLYKIIIISFGHMCHDIYTSFLSPILPILIKKFELTYSNAGFISVMLRLPSLLNPFIGAYADRFNLKYFVIFSPTITAISICLIGSAPDYTTILFLALFAGIGSSCFHVPSPVLLKRFAGNRIGAGMSSFQIGGELARTIGPIIVLGAVSIWTIDGIYRLIPIGLLCSLLFFWSFRDIPSETNKPEHNVRDSIVKTFRSDKMLFISILGIIFTKACTASIIAAFLPTYLSAEGKSLWVSGGALSIVEAFAVVGALVSGTLSDKIGCKRMLFILVVSAPFFMLLLLYSNGWLFVLSLVLLGLSAFSSTPVLLSLIQKKEFDYPSIANGLYMTSNFLLSSIIILLAGKLSDIAGIDYTFKLFAACSPIGILFIFLLKD